MKRQHKVGKQEFINGELYVLTNIDVVMVKCEYIDMLRLSTSWKHHYIVRYFSVIGNMKPTLLLDFCAHHII